MADVTASHSTRLSLMTKKLRPSKPFKRAGDAPNLPGTPFKFICYFVNQFRWWYVAIVILETLHATSGIMLPYTIGEIIRTVTRSAGNTQPMLATISQPLTMFAALSVGEVVFGRASGLLLTILHPIHRQHIVRSLYAYLQHHSHRYFSSSFAGALAHRIGETALGVTQTMQMLITEFMSVGIIFTVSTILLSRASSQLAALVGTWAILFVSISFWLATRCRPHAINAAAARSETTGKIVDSVTNITNSRLFARLGFERRYLNDQLRRELKEVRKSNWYSERVRWFQCLSEAVLKIGTLYYSISLWSQGKIGAADFVVATSLSLLIISQARNLSRRFLELFEHIGNISNGVSVIIQPHEIIDREKAIAHSITQGRIEFRHVDFSYYGDKQVFDNLSITIQPGERVGLVGFSGSGKSTFVNLILRLFEPQSGQILIDGVDIRDMTQDALHAQISLIPQDPSLFHRTLIENIRYGRLDAADDEVKEAARKAYADDFIAQIQEGYNSLVGERGVKLSGGQRQRVGSPYASLVQDPRSKFNIHSKPSR